MNMDGTGLESEVGGYKRGNGAIYKSKTGFHRQGRRLLVLEWKEWTTGQGGHWEEMEDEEGKMYRTRAGEVDDLLSFQNF